ncbi:MAG: flagellar assembly protein FliW, partial [Planctomycetota bacterium]|nr:flagellar assembly protein FliW [Planctomycetota bacterium]
DAQVLAIVNKRDETLTLNLPGPVVINIGNCTAMQLVLADKRWSTRQEIVRLEVPATRAVSA